MTQMHTTRIHSVTAGDNASTAAENKQQRIDRLLRDELVRGRWAPGDRLPTWDELETRFDVSRMTLRKGLAELQRDGFLVAATKRGTFVAEHPPHLCRFGIVLPESPNGSRWSSFFDALLRAGEAMGGDDARSFEPYLGIGWTPSERELARLAGDIRQRRLAGLLVISYAEQALEQASLLNTPLLPHVHLSMGHEPMRSAPAVPTISPNFEAFQQRAVRHLRQRGCQRIAVLLYGGTPDGWDARSWRAAIEAGGAHIPPYLLQGVPIHTPAWATSCVQLMMQLPPDQRPDGLIITDDVLTGPAVQGATSAGMTIDAPGDDGLAVISHRNFPASGDVPAGVACLGFDLLQALKGALRWIDPRETSEGQDRGMLLPALFAEERRERIDHEAPSTDPS